MPSTESNSTAFPESGSWGRLPPYKTASLPPLPGIVAYLGPGVIFMALAQGSGELIWWPYMIAKYGLAFLFLLIPACLLQFPVTYEIGRYTLLTGESIFQGFIRLDRRFALALWMLMTLSFLWFGAFAAAGGTSLAALTGLPRGWSPRGQTLFWGYLSMALFLAAILVSKVIYRLVEAFMWGVALFTLAGLLWACANPDVARALPEFLKALFVARWPPARPWDPADATKLLTAITFAGLGGFWTLFYSYWVRDKGVGMARYMGRITGPITGKPEAIPSSGFVPAEDGALTHLPRWQRYLGWDVGVGIGGNLLTTLMTCLLAYALLHPKGLVPQGYELAVVQSRFFEVSWGAVGRLLFLVVAAAFLSDTWLATADAVSRIHTDCIYAFFPRSRAVSVRTWYVVFLLLLTAITAITAGFAEPGPLILVSAVIGFVGTVIFSVALIFLNHRYLPPLLPPGARPGRTNLAFLCISCAAYALLAVVYLLALAGVM
ncbi:MAG TPA: Nramp family divalent metal transporter [candidate division Zixibacteria bacterium]|nr:Nramp family divalent metal transporter [candidate division Zixibacteria bacterium]